MDLSTTPGMQPPAGQTSHFNGPYSSLQIGTVISFGVTFFVATCFLSLRVFQAVKLIKNIELDLSKCRAIEFPRSMAWNRVFTLHLPNSYDYNFLWRLCDLFCHDSQSNEMGLGKTHVECLISGSYGIQQGQIGTSKYSKEV
ncbi:unnamed protein product [Penicillium pancosmium]